MRVNTWMVFELNKDGIPLGPGLAFDASAQGSDEAEAAFRQLVAKRTELRGEQIDEASDYGYARTMDGGTVHILHSQTTEDDELDRCAAILEEQQIDVAYDKDAGGWYWTHRGVRYPEQGVVGFVQAVRLAASPYLPAGEPAV